MVIATWKYFSVTCHLLNNLGDPSQLSQHKEMAHESPCSNHFQLEAEFLMLIQIHDKLILAWKTYRPIRHRLQGNILNTQRATSLLDLLTAHYHLRALNKTMDYLEDLRYVLPCLVPRPLVQRLDRRLYSLLANKLPNKFFLILKSGNEFPHRRWTHEVFPALFQVLWSSTRV